MNQGIILLIMVSIVSIVLTLALYDTNKRKWHLEERSYRTEQLIFGVVFGTLAILGTEFGIHYNGAVLNIRDAAPLCAALYFGPEAGIIAGLIGGIERWFAVYWGVGTFTRLACTVGTIVAGAFGALLKKYIFEDRVPGVVYAFGIGGVTEVFHMLMVYLFRGDEALQAHEVISACAPYMIPLVACTVAFPAYFISIFNGKSPFATKRSNRKIAQNIAIGLSISVLIAFVLSNTFQITLQNRLAKANAESMLSQSLTDVVTKLNASEEKEDEIQNLRENISYRHIGSSGEFVAINQNSEIVANRPSIINKENLSKILDDFKSGGEYELNIIKNKEMGNKNDYYFSYAQYKDYYIIGIYPAADADLIKNTSNTLTALLEIVILGVVFIMIYILIRIVVVKDLNTINEVLAAISSGKLDSVVEVNSSEEFTSLSTDINTTVDTLKKYIADAELRVAEELQMAHNIQKSALPSDFPNDDRFEIYANMLTAKDVGGDFYDFYPVGNDKYALLIADVSEKGIPAAMFMMSAKTTIKSIVETGATPAIALMKANEKLYSDNVEEMFVTVWLGIVDLNTGNMKYANAGHNYPVLIKKDGSTVFLKDKPGLVLAGMEKQKYKDYEIVIERGETIYLYTDGVSEAINTDKELFGEDRMLAAISESDIAYPKDICKHVKAKVDEFVGETPQFDDITMLAFRRQVEDNREEKIVTGLEPDSMDRVKEFFDEYIDKNNIFQEKPSKILIIVDEIYSNILQYSNATKAVITVKRDNERIIIEFKDDGVQFNPLESKEPDTTLGIEEREIGGLGLFIVKKTAESVKYKYEAGNNILEIVVKFE